MSKRTLVVGTAVIGALIAAGVLTRGLWAPEGAVAQAPAQAPRTFPVEVATAAKKSLPVSLHALGTVTPIASVVLKPRIDSVITGVHFADGASVKAGDVLFTLDSRSIEAQIQQAEGVLARDQAALEQAERDVARYTDLVAKRATPQVNLDNAKTAAATARANIKADEAAIRNLNVQLSYCTIRAPITGKISIANVKVGNFVRAGSDTVQLATIIQLAPVYVAFSIPQADLANLRQAVAAKTATVQVEVPGIEKKPTGPVTVIDNTVDTSTGMVMIRSTMANEDELLWPGTLVAVDVTLRMEEGIAVPSIAVQVSQTGTFVFVVKNNVAEVRPVKVARTVGSESVIASGLQAGEVVVTDGQLLLSNGSRVSVRAPKASS